ncbi:hypothetical protein [Sphingomonas japonica]|uniref:Cytochrome oxidase maturation protein, cbb3-type n=1 Tax=Sphingomonas japonica TaxID=511662 RepID=A0ABX0U7P7_9SPHN|nr:hypothetical protein [Sphingomonas japonica]NIJ24812.1 hypothetical protein [Sphingomonas japonica]
MNGALVLIIGLTSAAAIVLILLFMNACKLSGDDSDQRVGEREPERLGIGGGADFIPHGELDA